jgi:hypothetical protein
VGVVAAAGASVAGRKKRGAVVRLAIHLAAHQSVSAGRQYFAALGTTKARFVVFLKRNTE